MKEIETLEGYNYRLRPVDIGDAKFIAHLRSEENPRNAYIHASHPNIKSQVDWINNYIMEKKEYYWIVENIRSKSPEGTIAIYNLDLNPNRPSAEWGRWALKTNSLAAIESMYLLLEMAFKKLKLEKIYSLTITENKRVVSFHDNTDAKKGTTRKNYAQIKNQSYDVVEHYIDSQSFPTITSKLKKLIKK